MLNNEKDLFKSINELNNLLESITGNEVDIEIIKGKLFIRITKNKQVQSIQIPSPDDVKLSDTEDELRELYELTESLTEHV